METLTAWLASIPQLAWEPAAAALAAIAVAGILTRTRRAPGKRAKACPRCRDGYALRGLSYVEHDGRSISLRCPDCSACFAKEISSARVLKLGRRAATSS